MVNWCGIQSHHHRAFTLATCLSELLKRRRIRRRRRRRRINTVHTVQYSTVQYKNTPGNRRRRSMKRLESLELPGKSNQFENWCTDCIDCTNCTDCIDCTDFIYCTDCTNCTDLSNIGIFYCSGMIQIII